VNEVRNFRFLGGGAFLAVYRSLFSQNGLWHTTITVPIKLYDLSGLLVAMNLLC